MSQLLRIFDICLYVLSMYFSPFGGLLHDLQQRAISTQNRLSQGSNLLQFDLNEVYEKGPWRANCSKDPCKPQWEVSNAKEYKIQACNVSPS